MVGVPLLAEAVGEAHQAKIAATMMSGGALGTFIGAWAYGLVGPYGWRYVFFVGVVPAIILAIMRGRMLEPERFAGVPERRRAVAAGLRTETGDREFMRFVPLQLFSKAYRYNTMVGVLFGLGSLLAIWTTVIWLPTILSLMAQKSGAADTTAAVPVVSRGIMLWSLGGACMSLCLNFQAVI
jgi:MFS family permease